MGRKDRLRVSEWVVGGWVGDFMIIMPHWGSILQSEMGLQDGAECGNNPTLTMYMP